MDAARLSSLAINLFQRGLRREALVVINKASMMNLLEPGISCWHAEMLAFMGRTEEATRWMQVAMSANPTPTFCYQANGRLLMERGLFQESMACFDKALAISPGDATAIGYKAVILTANRFFSKAIECITSQLLRNPRDGQLLRLRAICHVEGLNNRDAIRDIDLAIEIDPGHGPAYVTRGFIKRDLKYPPASARQDFLLAKDNTTWKRGDCFSFFYAKALRGLGLHDDALRMIDEVLALVPLDRDYLIERGCNLLEMGRECEADLEFDRVNCLAPESTHTCTHTLCGFRVDKVQWDCV